MGSVSRYQRTQTKLNVKGTLSIAVGVANSDQIRQDLRESLDLGGSHVLAEIEIMAGLREADAVSHAQQCLIFAICSPQCRFETNVRAARRFADCLHHRFDSVDAVYQALTHNGSDSWVTAGMAARNLYASLDFLRNVTDSDMSKAVILAMRKAGKVKGLGHKTTSMALALYDGTAEVYTLDVHMLRGILRAIGREDLQAGTMTITDAAYPILEAAMIALHEEVCPELPIFASQWALWSYWGFGSHISHAGIFA